MASRPGFLTDWPWKRLGNFKYWVLAPWAAHSVYAYMTKEEGERDFSRLLIVPALLSRVVHTLIWISLSRFQMARSKHRIVNRGIEFEQVDREMNWYSPHLSLFLNTYSCTFKRAHCVNRELFGLLQNEAAEHPLPVNMGAQLFVLSRVSLFVTIEAALMTPPAASRIAAKNDGDNAWYK